MTGISYAINKYYPAVWEKEDGLEFNLSAMLQFYNSIFHVLGPVNIFVICNKITKSERGEGERRVSFVLINNGIMPKPELELLVFSILALTIVDEIEGQVINTNSI